MLPCAKFPGWSPAQHISRWMSGPRKLVLMRRISSCNPGNRRSCSPESENVWFRQQEGLRARASARTSRDGPRKGACTSRILVIEDNPTNLQLVMYLLQAFGHAVRGAKEGAEGIELARRERPDIILLDIHMPRMDGYEVARRLRADPQSRDISIVAVTALAMVGDREKLMDAGFDGYISKPIDPETFPGKVQEFLQQPASPRCHVRGQENDTCQVTSEVAPRAEKRGIFLFVDNSAANLQLARSILESQGYEILTASSVEEGIKLARSRRPNLIVSDIHMPQHDGYYFLDLLHADSELRHIPFVFLSASMQSERERSFAESRGASKLLIRPIDPQTLLGELESCLPR